MKTGKSWLLSGFGLTSLLLAGCLPHSPNEVVVYTALDKEFSEPILDDFQADTDGTVLAKYDVESTKTVGLANEIISQSGRQRCDLFWNNEILHTLRLKQQGLLVPYDSPLADQYPASFVSRDRDWYGFAARARVLIINTDLLPDRASWPNSVTDLADPRWQGNCGMARPLFGTTATHAAVLFSQLGEEEAKVFLSQVARHAQIEGGNKQVATNVARGRYAFGLTDTDDAIIEVENGAPVAIVFPDQQPDQPGALLIPNTLALIKGGPNLRQAQRLMDYLLQQQVEERLAAGPSAQIPLNLNSQVASRVEPSRELKVMEVDFEAAAALWSKVTPFLEATFPVGGPPSGR
ncbi:MAG: extracellular solute-binding protein [Mariniblastus sp.]|nr:extracellular solute-binding protein [Mariniblastus sp.]